MGKQVFVIADSHFDDKVMVRFRKDNFHNLEDMNRTLSKIWRGVGGRIWFLGDMVRDRHPGRWIKHLGPEKFVKGNHDKGNFPLFFKTRWGNMRFLLVHNPRMAFSRRGWVIHGHVHTNPSYPFFDPLNKRINVSWDVVGAPVPLSLIIHLIKHRYPRVNRLWELEHSLLRAHYNGSIYVVDNGFERFKRS